MMMTEPVTTGMNCKTDTTALQRKFERGLLVKRGKGSAWITL